MSIFVSIAAYRDPELAPTIADCIRRARCPDELHFGVCWQHTADEVAPAEFARPNVRVIDVPWNESRGACWARAEIMQLWDGEDFFLQLDSHHRFVQDWDAKLIAEAERSGAEKPVLSTYATPYDPRAPALETGAPTQMDFHRFSTDGVPMFRPRHVTDRSDPSPMRARFVSAHFLFAPGRFVREVPYDPELYFHGEEITLAIRAFTHGYALLHPSEHLLWHEYTRNYRAKHWDDHVRARGIPLEWHMRDQASIRKVRKFLLDPHVGAFGCGTARSVAEYEAYAGLSFRHMAAQDATLRGLEPPNPATTPDWPTAIRDWRVRIVLDREALSRAAFIDPSFWYVGFHDAADAEICREDAHGDELQQLLAGSVGQIVIERRFRSARQPAAWTVWPHSRNGGWLEKVVGTVDAGSVSANG
jgi:hypothetical protein